MIEDYRVCHRRRGSLGCDLLPSGRTVAIWRMTLTERWSRSTVFPDRETLGSNIKSATLGDRLQVSAGGKRDEITGYRIIGRAYGAVSHRLPFLNRFVCVGRSVQPGNPAQSGFYQMIWISGSAIPSLSTNRERSFQRSKRYVHDKASGRGRRPL